MLFDFEVLQFNHSEIIFTLVLLFAHFIFSLFFFFFPVDITEGTQSSDRFEKALKVMELDHTLPWVGGKETGYEGKIHTENSVS